MVTLGMVVENHLFLACCCPFLGPGQDKGQRESRSWTFWDLPLFPAVPLGSHGKGLHGGLKGHSFRAVQAMKSGQKDSTTSHFT